MSEFTEDRIDDAYTVLNKTGHVMRDSRLKALEPMASSVYDAFDGEVLFDVYYDGAGLDSITFTEIMSQGLLINPCNDELRYRLARIALEDDDTPVPAERILSAGRLDKYRLLKGFDRSALDSVIFLPGSNLLNDAVDWVLVKELASQGAMLKLHPITSSMWERRLSQLFPSQVISRRQSGFDVLARAKRVYSTVNSEMGLLGILMDREVGLVDSTPTATRPIYRQLYEAVMPQSDRKSALEKVLGSRHAGLFWSWQPESRATEIIEAIKRQSNA